jgi:hypothetical protein
VLEPTQIGVEFVTRNEPGSDPAGDRLKFAVANQRANVVLGAAELGGNLADRQGAGHSMPGVWLAAAAAPSFAKRRAPGARVWAVEGAGHYGACLARFLSARGEAVHESGRTALVSDTKRCARRPRCVTSRCQTPVRPAASA